ncbi:MAG: sugar O-acyltransferase (sialic acid O-acetyltransferase NeuD family) [Sediminicola sp.]|jgi:sugar O-acyltransferase (sialic acid O-acetyltransferase NeuD family)
MEFLAIIGAGGHGKICAAVAETLGWQVAFYDKAFPNVKSCGKWDVKGNEEDLINNKKNIGTIFIAIGNNKIRELKQLELASLGFSFTSLVSPNATVHADVHIGNGVIVVDNACINIDSFIGDGCIVNTGANIDHDCHLSAFSHVCPGANLAGEVKIGSRTWIGIGSSIIQQINIGQDVLIGAGTSVINNIPDKVTVVGCPGRILNKE